MKKQSPSNWSNTRAAREYAKAHGYYGDYGGWIYSEKAEPEIRYTREGVASFRRSRFLGKPVCQGWEKFYRIYKREIEAYCKSLEN